MKTLVYIFGFIIFFNGCAPQYVVRNQYIPSIDKNSKICLQNCSVKKQDCKQRCAEDYSDCLSYAYDEAKKIQIESDKNYKKRYSRYQSQLSDYNFNIFDWHSRYDEVYKDWRYFSNKCLKNGDKYACRREINLRYVMKKLRIDKPNKPREPKYVTFDKILSKQQNKCSKRCGCDDIYDSCFVGCGGEIVPHRICIKNCD